MTLRPRGWGTPSRTGRDRPHRHLDPGHRADWGAEISRKAFTGLIAVLIAIALYIAFRFEGRCDRRHDRARARRRDHRGDLRARRARGHPGDRDRDPDDPRVLALRHRRDLRQDKGEHRIRRARRAARLHRRGRPLAEPGADAVGEHVAGRAPADPVPAAVRRRYPEGLRVRDVRGGRDRRVFLDLHRRARAHDPEGPRSALPPARGTSRGARGRRRAGDRRRRRRDQRGRGRRRGEPRDRAAVERPRPPSVQSKKRPPAKRKRR